jgi:hypothetical protein
VAKNLIRNTTQIAGRSRPHLSIVDHCPQSGNYWICYASAGLRVPDRIIMVEPDSRFMPSAGEYPTDPASFPERISLQQDKQYG